MLSQAHHNPRRILVLANETLVGAALHETVVASAAATPTFSSSRRLSTAACVTGSRTATRPRPCIAPAPRVCTSTRIGGRRRERDRRRCRSVAGGARRAGSLPGRRDRRRDASREDVELARARARRPALRALGSAGAARRRPPRGAAGGGCLTAPLSQAILRNRCNHGPHDAGDSNGSESSSSTTSRRSSTRSRPPSATRATRSTRPPRAERPSTSSHGASRT